MPQQVISADQLVSTKYLRNVLIRGMPILDAFLIDEIRATDDNAKYETVFVKLAEEKIEKMVKGEEDKESYVSEFAESMINDDDDDSGTRIEPRIHKENLKVIDDKKDEDVEKMDDVAEKKDNDDHTDHTLVRTRGVNDLSRVEFCPKRARRLLTTQLELE
nr:hypothetical protein [Tanacetum cinerariifolium]